MLSARMVCPKDNAPLRKRTGGVYACPVCRHEFRPGELVESWQDTEPERVLDSTDPRQFRIPLPTPQTELFA
jgi:uncharacterized Zn finger protein (UPF0148 family)